MTQVHSERLKKPLFMAHSNALDLLLPSVEAFPSTAEAILKAENDLYQALEQFDLAQSKRQSSDFISVNTHQAQAVQIDRIKAAMKSCINGGVEAAIDAVGSNFQFRSCVFFMSYNGDLNYVGWADSFVAPGIKVLEA